jgi:hypothetical protein
MTFANRKTPGRGAPLNQETMCLVTKTAPARLDIDEGEIAAELEAHQEIEGRPASWVWLSSGAAFLWARDKPSSFKGYP